MPPITRETLEAAAWFPNHAYPFVSHFMEHGGNRLHYLDEGSGPVVVLVHGTPSWSFEFRHLVRALRTTHRCLVLDHLGFGLSDRPADADYGVAAHAARFAAWMAHLQLPPCTLLVHDFGGPIALPYALQQPARISRLVLGNTWFWPFEQVDAGFAKQKPMLDNALMRWMYLRLNFSARVMMKSAWGTHAPLQPSTHACYHRMFPSRDSRLATWACAQAMVHADGYFAQQAQPAGLQGIPTLIAWGQADSFVPAQHLAHWRQMLPQAEVFECPKAGHFVFDEAADLVVPRLRSFLQQG